jgi:Glu-tRNA(Gln) amidotransferase subunit E-like FAD-binding protein
MFKRKPKGDLFCFEEFTVYSPKQFNNNLSLEDKDITFYIKVCTNSNRAFTCPFPHIDKTVGIEELSKKEVKKIVDFINNTPEAIVYTSEYSIENIDGRRLEQYYGKLDTI